LWRLRQKRIFDVADIRQLPPVSQAHLLDSRLKREGGGTRLPGRLNEPKMCCVETHHCGHADQGNGHGDNSFGDGKG
jgi:hypothetical protein